MGKDGAGGSYGGCVEKEFYQRKHDGNRNSFQAGFQAAIESEQVQGLVEALEFYTRAGQTKTIRGKIIEYDVDAGPLYETYEIPYCDSGQTARQALEKFRETK